MWCHSANVSMPAIRNTVIAAAATPMSTAAGGSGSVTSTNASLAIGGAHGDGPRAVSRVIPTSDDIIYYSWKIITSDFSSNISVVVARNRPPRVATDEAKPRRGRPKKYGRDSRAVTVTLPEDVLASLHALDADLGRAIVRLVERQGTTGAPALRPAELATYGTHAVIVVTPARALKRLPGVQLVPVGNGRALIALDRPLAIPQLELDVRDALHETEVTIPERTVLKGLADILQQARSSRAVSVNERTIIVLESKRWPRQEKSR
jgi:hypothetical protein